MALPSVTGLRQVSQDPATGATGFDWDATPDADEYAVNVDGTVKATVTSPTATVTAAPGAHTVGVAPIALPTPKTTLAFTVPGGTGKSTFNVMDYGADPSGKTLSSTAFLNARLAAQKYGPGGTIYAPSPSSQGFPGGHYYIDDAANTPGCIHLEAPGIGIMGDGDDEFTGTKILLATAKIGPNGRRSGIIGVPAGSDGCAIEGLFLDAQSSPGNNTYPQIKNNPDPEILNVSSSHNRVKNISGRAGTGFCVRFVGASPCYDFTVGDNQYEGGVLEGLSYGGGFITLDVDCQGHFGPSLWTYIKNVSIFGNMAVYNDCYVSVDGLTYTPNKYNPPCQACVEVSTTGKGPSHDLTFANIVSNGGKIKIESYDSAPPIQNLILPSGKYWAAACP